MRSYVYIPRSRRTAKRHLKAALREEITAMPKRAFLKAYCCMAYLYPGFHPDGIEDWEGPVDKLPIAREVLRRADAGQLTDDEVYPYQATRGGGSRKLEEH